MQSIATIASMYNQGIVFLVGFIVSQLFVAVVCFGFDGLAGQLAKPVFDSEILGRPKLMSGGDDEDNLCACCEPQEHVLMGLSMEDPPKRGERGGIRINLHYLHHKSAPKGKEGVDSEGRPHRGLDKEGLFLWERKQEVEFDALVHPSQQITTGEVHLEFKEGYRQGTNKSASARWEHDEYAYYRQTMHKIQDVRTLREIEETKTPPPAAVDNPEIQELEYDYDELKAWSNETLHSTDILLRAQEKIAQDVAISYYRDNDGGIGEELPLGTVLRDLIPPGGIKDEVTVPDVTVHMRAKVKVRATMMSNDQYTAELDLIGNETMLEVKKAIVGQYRQRSLLLADTLQTMTMMIDEDFVEDQKTLWYHALKFVDNGHYDPLHSAVELNVMIDAGEKFVVSPPFDNFIIVSILINTLFLCFDHYDKEILEKPYMTDAWDTTMIASGWIFNVIFFMEMIIKFVAMKGFGNYWRVGSNQFDFVIVMSSLVNIVFDALGIDFALVKVMRIFRALRIVRVLRRLEPVRLIVDAAFGSINSVINIFTFMMVVIIVFACLGMQFYGNMFDEYGDGILCSGKPRANFDNFYTAFFALFQVLTGSAWELVLYDCINACQSNGVVGAVYVIMFFVLSNYIILNLFIGAVLANMESMDDDGRLKKTHSMRQESEEVAIRAREAQLFVNRIVDRWEANGCEGDVCALHEVLELDCALKTFQDSHIVEGKTRFGYALGNTTMGCCSFTPAHPFRKFCIQIVEHAAFDITILLVIIYSTVLLALDNPTTRASDAWVNFFTINDYIFLIVFTVEFVCKCVSHGFINTDNIELMLSSPDKVKALILGDLGRESYMYDPWNYLDITVLLVGYIGLLAAPDGPLKLLRLCRAFRPLRMVNRVKGMRLILVALGESIGPLANVCILLLATYLIFAILGVGMFKGKFYACDQCFGDYCDSFLPQNECFGQVDGGGYLTPRTWNNPAIFQQPLTYGVFSFDDVGSAYQLLFEVSTGDSWETMLWATTNIPAEAHETPSCNGNWAWGFYMIIFVFVGQLFMIQLFVAVIIDTFVNTEGSGDLTEQQAILADVLRMTKMLIPEPKWPCPSQEGEFVPDSIRSTAYLMFTDVRPLPVQALEDYLAAEKIPSVERVMEIPRVKRSIDATAKERDRLMKNDAPKSEIDTMARNVEEMEADLSNRTEDSDMFNEFRWETLISEQPPEGWVYVSGLHFDTVITVCILLNIFFMTTFHYEQSDGWTEVQWMQNVIFTVIFVIELIIKHLGLGFKGYWIEPLNAFDGIVVGVSIIFIPLEGGAIAGLFRVCRIFRLIKRAPKIKALMVTLVETIPAITNVFMVLFLVFFIFAVVAVELFGSTRYGTSISVVSNFSTWLDAIHLLWRNALGNWRSTKYDTFVIQPDCTNLAANSQPDLDEPSTDCGDPMKGAVFFLLFMVAATFAVLNLVIAIILNSFTWIYTLEPSEVTGDLNVSKDELEHFQAIWCRFDVQGEAAIPLSSLQTLLAISRRNIDKMFLTGYVNQRDEEIYRDYSSWGTGENGADANEVEEENHENFNQLVKWLAKLEEHKEVYKKIEDSGVDVSAGENSDVFTEDIERYNHTGNIKLFTREGDVKKLHAVEFESLVSILVADPLGLSDHDIFVVNNYRHPYTAVIPGYLPSSISSDGLHVLLPGEEEKGSLEMEVFVDNPIQNSSPSPEPEEVCALCSCVLTSHTLLIPYRVFTWLSVRICRCRTFHYQTNSMMMKELPKAIHYQTNSMMKEFPQWKTIH